jgi:hypothetical protein
MKKVLFAFYNRYGQALPEQLFKSLFSIFLISMTIAQHTPAHTCTFTKAFINFFQAFLFTSSRKLLPVINQGFLHSQIHSEHRATEF